MIAATGSTLLISRVSVAGDRIVGAPDFCHWSRLAQAMAQVDDVVVDLQVERRGRNLQIDGELRLLGRLHCERCLGAMPCNLRQNVRVLVAESEEAPVEADRDLVLAPQGRLAVQEWLEEEALLALPLLPKCEEWASGVCPVSGIEVPSLDANR